MKRIQMKSPANHFTHDHGSWRRPCIQFIVLVLLTSLFIGSPAFPSDDALGILQALKSGEHFALLRHATAPGTGDPPQFTLAKCETQRNLSDEGRNQAVRIGARFRKNGIMAARVFSSQWCRCLETARLLDIGIVNELPVLNSFFQNHSRREPQIRQLSQWLKWQPLKTPLVLVTHQVNITALTGIYPRSGEMVIVHRSLSGKMTPLGTISAP